MQDGDNALQVVRMKVAALAVQFLFKLFCRISDHTEKIRPVPEHSAAVPCIQAGKTAGNRAQQRVLFPALFLQFKFARIHIMGQFHPRHTAVPVDEPVFYHKCPLKDRIVKFPLVILVLTQFIVGTEGAGIVSSLDHFIAFTAYYFFQVSVERTAGSLVQIEQIISLNIADVDVSVILLHHHLKILCIVIITGGLACFFRFVL